MTTLFRSIRIVGVLAGLWAASAAGVAATAPAASATPAGAPPTAAAPAAAAPTATAPTSAPPTSAPPTAAAPTAAAPTAAAPTAAAPAAAAPAAVPPTAAAPATRARSVAPAAHSALAAATAPTAPASADLAQERQAVEQWKARRLASLTSETGWLTLTGLYWLKPGDNTFGRAKSNALRLDNASLADKAGKFVVKGDKVRFVARKGSGITHEGAPVTDIELAADTTGKPTLLKSGSLTFFLIERAGKLGVRVRDSENPHRKHFAGLEYFPFDDSWVVDARFEPYEARKTVKIVNILGMEEDLVSPGALVFTRDGKEYRLDAVLEAPEDTELFVMFADATSGRETYGAGRFIYVPMPANGIVRVNFNKSYNPPCAFNEFATCPLPPPQNRLTSLRIEAGEKNYAGGH